MRARFQIYVQGCTASPFSCLFQRKNFRMFYALIGVKAFASNFAVHFNNDGADARIRRRQPNALACQIQSAAKKRFVGFELRSHELSIISLEAYTRTGCADIARARGETI